MPLATEENAEAPASTKFVSKRIPADKLTEFMTTARERYAFALQLDAEDRSLAEDYATFAAAIPLKEAGSSQWNEQEARKRIGNSRPCLTENRLPTFTAQVVNDGRQKKPAIKISAMDNGTKETGCPGRGECDVVQVRMVGEQGAAAGLNPTSRRDRRGRRENNEHENIYPAGVGGFGVMGGNGVGGFERGAVLSEWGGNHPADYGTGESV